MLNCTDFKPRRPHRGRQRGAHVGDIGCRWPGPELVNSNSSAPTPHHFSPSRSLWHHRMGGEPAASQPPFPLLQSVVEAGLRPLIEPPLARKPSPDHRLCGNCFAWLTPRGIAPHAGEMGRQAGIQNSESGERAGLCWALHGLPPVVRHCSRGVSQNARLIVPESQEKHHARTLPYKNCRPIGNRVIGMARSDISMDLQLVIF